MSTLWFEGGSQGRFAAFLQALREATDWRRSVPEPTNSGAFDRDAFIILYVDVVRAGVVVSCLRVDHDGRRAVAARVAAEHADQGTLLDPSDLPELERASQVLELRSPTPDGVAGWFEGQLAQRSE